MSRISRVSDAGAVALLCGIVIGLALLSLAGLAHGQERPRKPVVCDDASSLLAVLCEVPVHRSDVNEPSDDRGGRLMSIESAISSATDDLTERAWLAMTASRESGLARFVDLDLPRCSEGHKGWCDSGRAFSLWQLWGVTGRDLDRAGAALLAIERFRRSANYCAARGHDYWVGGTSLFATGRSCDWPEATERVDDMWLVRSEL